MIKNRLSVLLAEKGLKITRVAKDTGISRNTITATAQNDTEMIRLGTINTLCKYLNVTPGEFFDFEPLDITFSMEVVSMPFKVENDNGARLLRCESIEADLFMDIDWDHKRESIDLTCELVSEFTLRDNLPIPESGNPLAINLKVKFDGDEEKNFFKDEIYMKINSSFYRDIYQSLIKTITNSVRERLIKNIDLYTEKHLDLKHVYVGMGDQIYLDSMKESVEQLTISVESEVFLPF